MKRLNLGCGNDIRNGYVNLDDTKLNGVDVIHNLNNYPYPFKNNTFDKIIAKYIIEHLNDIPKVLREIHRISKDNAIIEIGVPYFASVGAWTDLTHKHPFGYCSLDYMCNNITDKRSIGYHNKWAYGKEQFEIIKRKFVFGKLHRMIGIDWFAHKFPMFYEHYLPFIFPARHIEFTIKTIKGDSS